MSLIEAHKTRWDWKTILNVPLNEPHKTTWRGLLSSGFPAQFVTHISPLHVVLWVSLSGTLRIVFHSHLVLCASMRLIVRNNFIFCFFNYFSNFFSKFWYFIILINPNFLTNFKNILDPCKKPAGNNIFHYQHCSFL